MAGRGAQRRYTDSFKVFKKNVKRSRAFITIFDQNRSAGRPKNEEAELLRGALVFAIGALDNFLHELILEIVPRFGGNGEALRQPLAQIAKDDPGLALRVALAPAARAKHEFRSALDTWLETKSFQGVEKIVGAQRYLGVTMDESTLQADWKQRLGKFTDERHAIVHRGSDTVIKRDEANDCVDLIEAIGNAINRVAVKYYRR
jgi:hypothetical protein